jgi:hypothetical protein
MGGGGGLPWLLLLMMLQFLVFAISSVEGYIRFLGRGNKRGDREDQEKK